MRADGIRPPVRRARGIAGLVVVVVAASAASPAYAVVAGDRSSTAAVTSVVFGGTRSAPSLTVRGSGFGTIAALGPPEVAGGCGGTGSDYQGNFYFSDITHGWNAGQGPGDCVGVIISSYSDTRVTFTFGSSYASLGESLAKGDSFTMTVLGSTRPGTVSYRLHITTMALPAGRADVRYAARLSASGGGTPYSWSVVRGSLPAGLSLSRHTGRISGKPVRADIESTSTFRVRVRGGKASAEAVLSVTVVVAPGPSVRYRTFAGGHVELTPWAGRHVAVLVPPGSFSNPAVITKILIALDAAWNFYASVTGRQPALYRQYHGRDSIAVVATSCGAACSYLGATGSEINEPYFAALYDGVRKDNQYDQVMFYEFGRNFWFYGSQLAPGTTYGSTVTTGYAVLMRFESMNAIGVHGGPFDGVPFPAFEAQDWGIAHAYDADLTKTFANTLAAGLSPSVYGGTDFFASIVHMLAVLYGGHCFIRHLLTTVLREPAASTDDAAVANFVKAAGHVAGANLRPFFYDYWAFPEPDGTTNPRQAGGIAALPSPSSRALCPARPG